MKKTDRKKSELKDLSSKEIENILFPEAPIQPSDVGMVFGRGLMTGFQAKKAAALFQAGYIKKILVTGGVPALQSKDTPAYIKAGIITELNKSGLPLPTQHNTEAEWAKRILIECGVPSTAILVENESQHTGMNVTESIEKFGIDKADRILVISEFTHARRLVETLRNYIPKVSTKSPAISTCPVFMPGVTRKNWMRKSYIVDSFIKPELEKLGFISSGNDDYIKQGFIKEINWSDEAAFFTKKKRVNLAIRRPIKLRA